MGKQYKEKQPTGREYVDLTEEFCTTTIFRCQKLPRKWNDIFLLPLIQDAERIESLVSQANAVYIDKKSKSGYEERIAILSKALRIFADYDKKFNRMMNQIHFASSEKRRLKNLLLNIIETEKKVNPDFQKIEIKQKMRMDEIEYISMNGQRCIKLALTSQNRDHWLKTEIDAKDAISNRISNDRRNCGRG